MPPRKLPILSKLEFKSIYETYFDNILNFLYYHTKDIKLSEDLVQQVFLILWEKRENIIRETVKSYLYTIAGNLLKKHIAHQHIAYKFRSAKKVEYTIENPEYLMEMDEFHSRLNRVISDMEVNVREAFLMNRIDKLTYVEIAERLKISIKTVEKRMSKALTIMRSFLRRKV